MKRFLLHWQCGWGLLFDGLIYILTFTLWQTSFGLNAAKKYARYIYNSEPKITKREIEESEENGWN